MLRSCTSWLPLPRAPLAEQKQEESKEVLAAVERLKAAGALPKWGGVETPQRRNVMQGELRMVGMKSPEKIAVLSVRNDAAFLISVVGTTSVSAGERRPRGQPVGTCGLAGARRLEPGGTALPARLAANCCVSGARRRLAAAPLNRLLLRAPAPVCLRRWPPWCWASCRATGASSAHT